MPVIVITQNTTVQSAVTPDNVYTGISEVSIRQENPGFSYNADTDLALGNGASDNSVANFFLSSLSQVPSNATINNAYIRLVPGGGFGSFDVVAHSSLRVAVQAEATYNSYAAGSAWQTAGARGALDRNAAVSAATTISDAASYNIPITAEIAELVAAGSDQLLIAPAVFDGDGGFRNFVKSTGADGGRPEVVVDWSISAGPTVVTPGQTFSVPENSAADTVVGSVVTTGDAPTNFAIAGTEFDIDSAGEITVASGADLDFETTPQYVLAVTPAGGTAENVTINLSDVAEQRSIDSITGTLAPNETIQINTTGLDDAPTIQAATLGGETLTINSWSATAVSVSIPVDINLDWGAAYDLVLGDDTGTVTLTNQTLNARSGWEYMNYGGEVLDFANTESFRELIENDHSTVLVNGSQVRATSLTDVDYYDDTTVDFPSGPVTGGEYSYRHAGAVSVIYPFTKSDFISAPSFSGNQNITIAENTPFSHTVNVSNPNGPTTLGGPDVGVFTFVDNGSSASISLSAFNYEAPADQGTDNIYNVTFSNGGVDYPVVITITDDQAEFTIDAIANASVDEGVAYTSVAPNITGTPEGAVTYSLTGVDASQFTVNTSTGVVSMVARSFGAPADANGNNVYEIGLIATDSVGQTATQVWTVTVNQAVVVGNVPIITPGQSFSFDENSPVGTSIGTLAATLNGTIQNAVSSSLSVSIDANLNITVAQTGIASGTLSSNITLENEHGIGQSVAVTFNVNEVVQAAAPDVEAILSAISTLSTDEVILIRNRTTSILFPNSVWIVQD